MKTNKSSISDMVIGSLLFVRYSNIMYCGTGIYTSIGELDLIRYSDSFWNHKRNQKAVKTPNRSLNCEAKLRF